jgi:tetratricopeptide (TPR) repeat protein
VEDAIAINEEILRRDPRDPLAHYGIAVFHVTEALTEDGTARLDLALKHFDESINIKPLVAALLWKANLQAAWKGDFDAADATLERVAALPLEQATEDRAIFFRMWIALLEKKPGNALAASALTTTTYFSDAQVRGPIAWLKAFAHRQAGRESAAAEEWRAAETVLRARLATDPNSLPAQAELAVTHAMQGRKDEAVREFSRFDAWTRERGMPGLGAVLHMRFHSAMGDGRRTVAAVKEVRKRNLFFATKIVLQRDPWFDRVRGQPEFKALMRELDGKKGA